MSIMAFLRNHAHYWGISHPRNSDSRLIQTCYECGAERIIKIELRRFDVDEIAEPVVGGHLAA